MFHLCLHKAEQDGLRLYCGHCSREMQIVMKAINNILTGLTNGWRGLQNASGKHAVPLTHSVPSENVTYPETQKLCVYDDRNER